MSCSLWRWTEACEGKPCVGDCDLCDWNTEDEEEEADDEQKRSDDVI